MSSGNAIKRYEKGTSVEMHDGQKVWVVRAGSGKKRTRTIIPPRDSDEINDVGGPQRVFYLSAFADGCSRSAYGRSTMRLDGGSSGEVGDLAFANGFAAGDSDKGHKPFVNFAAGGALGAPAPPVLGMTDDEYRDAIKQLNAGAASYLPRSYSCGLSLASWVACWALALIWFSTHPAVRGADFREPGGARELRGVSGCECRAILNPVEANATDDDSDQAHYDQVEVDRQSDADASVRYCASSGASNLIIQGTGPMSGRPCYEMFEESELLALGRSAYFQNTGYDKDGVKLNCICVAAADEVMRTGVRYDDATRMLSNSTCADDCTKACSADSAGDIYRFGCKGLEAGQKRDGIAMLLVWVGCLIPMIILVWAGCCMHRAPDRKMRAVCEKLTNESKQEVTWQFWSWSPPSLCFPRRMVCVIAKVPGGLHVDLAQTANPVAAAAGVAQVEVVQMQCPAGSSAGSLVQSEINGKMVQITVPVGVSEGQMFQVQVPT